MYYIKRDDLTVQNVENEVLLLDVTANNIHQLNASATLVWQHCTGDQDADQLAALLADHFDVDAATARADIDTILQQLLSLNLIRAVK